MGLYGEMRQGKMAVRTLLAVLLALLLLLAISPPKAAKAADVVVAATRIGGDNNRTRFVADISTAVSYTVYVLPDPYRVIIDMPGVTFNLPPGTGRKSRGLIGEYRFGQVAAGRARIVLATAGPVLIEKSFVVDAQGRQPARIVVDLVPISEEAFLDTYSKEDEEKGKALARAAAEDDDLVPLPIPEIQNSLPAKKQTAIARDAGRKLIVIDPGHGGIDPG
ncbi:MAG TPA: AMIN domain-containing protein, partial [Aestuariivirga sp.]|nr:AMIN domain-containing protein [Aestuariivirga sp.]